MFLLYLVVFCYFMSVFLQNSDRLLSLFGRYLSKTKVVRKKSLNKSIRTHYQFHPLGI
jgi:hypothetical protein